MRIPAILSLASFFLVAGCTQIDDVSQDNTRQTVSAVVQADSVAQATFIVTVTFDSSAVTVAEAQELVDNVGVSTDVSIGVFEAEDSAFVVPAADTHWNIPGDHGFEVEVVFDPNFDAIDMGDLDPDDYNWEWIDLADVQGWCPPGHGG
jgi:hypothetical protein